MLGARETSVERWADLGVLRCVPATGERRRFARDEVERFAEAVRAGHPDMTLLDPPAPLEASLPLEPAVERWTDRLLTLDPSALQDALLAEHDALGSWWKVADLVGAAVTELGNRWECGRSTVIEVRLASERLTRRITRLVETSPMPAPAPLALLATAAGDEHTLGLALTELVLRELGYQVGWIGHDAPPDSLAAYVHERAVAVIGLSASVASCDEEVLREAVLPVADACQEVGTRLILGGRGRWPDDLPATTRVHTFAQLYVALHVAV